MLSHRSFKILCQWLSARVLGKQCLLALWLIAFSLALPSIVSADIFEWEWIDPANHSLGKQQSTTLVPDGAGLVPEPGLYVSNKNLTKALLADYDLSDAYLG